MIKTFFGSTAGQEESGGEPDLIQYATFDGSNDYLNIPTITQSFAAGFTLEGWFRFGASITLYTGLFGLGTTAEGTIRVITLTNNPAKSMVLYVNKEDGGNPGKGANDFFLSNTWNYYGMVVDISTGFMTFYRDDVVINHEFTSLLNIKNITRTGNKLGRDNNSPTRHFPMDCRNVKFWTIPRTASQIAQRGVGVGPQSGLLIDYPLATDFLDVSGNNLHATQSGGVTFNQE